MYTQQLSINMSLGLNTRDRFKLGSKPCVDTEGNIVAQIGKNRKKTYIQNITLGGIVYYYREIKGKPIIAYRENDKTPYHIGWCKSIDGEDYYYTHNNGNVCHDCDKLYTKSGKCALTNYRSDAPIRTEELRKICAKQEFCTIYIRESALTLSFAGICSDTKKIMIYHIPNIYSISIENHSPYIMFQVIAYIDDKRCYFGNKDSVVGYCPSSNILCYTSHRVNGKPLHDWMPTIEDILANLPTAEEIKIEDIEDFSKVILYLDTLKVSKDGVLII